VTVVVTLNHNEATFCKRQGQESYSVIESMESGKVIDIWNHTEAFDM